MDDFKSELQETRGNDPTIEKQEFQEEIATSEVDVTTIASEEEFRTNEAGEEFLGSSLSGKSIYGPPRVRRVEADVVDEEGEESRDSSCDASGTKDKLLEGPDRVSNKSSSASTGIEGGSGTEIEGSAGGSADQILPDWKRKIQEKKEEKKREEEREREKWESIPAWRRKLLESKTSKDRHSEEAPASSSPAVGEGPATHARFWGVTLKKTKEAPQRDSRSSSDEDDDDDDDDDNHGNDLVDDVNTGLVEETAK